MVGPEREDHPVTMLAERFDRAVGVLLAEHPEDDEGRMFHSRGLRTGGHFYAFCPTTDGVVLKLPAARVAELVASAEGAPCSPRPGRPMREWVRVDPVDGRTLTAYLREARSFVAG
jgi:hypothetical protein